MNLKKGISYIAFGFLFTLVNVNLTFGDSAVNIMPAFVGWILFFLAYDKLGTYVEDKAYLKWMSFGLIIVTGVIWILGIGMPWLDLELIETIAAVVSAVYMFILFTALEKVARDYDPPRESTIRVLKYLNLILYLCFALTSILYSMTQVNDYLLFSMIIGTAALVSAIVTMFVLFGLRKSINKNLPDAE